MAQIEIVLEDEIDHKFIKDVLIAYFGFAHVDRSIFSVGSIDYPDIYWMNIPEPSYYISDELVKPLYIIPNLSTILLVFATSYQDKLNHEDLIGEHIIYHSERYEIKTISTNAMISDKTDYYIDIQNVDTGKDFTINSRVSAWRLALTDLIKTYIARKNGINSKN